MFTPTGDMAREFWQLTVWCERATACVAVVLAGELQPILDQKSEATAQLLETVTADREEASKVQQVVEKDAAEVKAFQQEVQAIADDAKADLAEALPVLESAVKSLNALNKSDIVEMKSFSKPPPLVMLTMEAVCTLRQEKPDWDTAKRMLGDTNFMEALKTFDKENIPDVVIKKLKKCGPPPSYPTGWQKQVQILLASMYKSTQLARAGNLSVIHTCMLCLSSCGSGVPGRWMAMMRGDCTVDGA